MHSQLTYHMPLSACTASTDSVADHRLNAAGLEVGAPLQQVMQTLSEAHVGSVAQLRQSWSEVGSLLRLGVRMQIAEALKKLPE